MARNFILKTNGGNGLFMPESLRKIDITKMMKEGHTTRNDFGAKVDINE